MEKKILEIKHCEMGFPYYESLPDGFKQAEYSDLFNLKSEPLLGRAILIKSQMTENRYWANRIKPGFPYILSGSDMLQFIDDGCIYINTIFV